MVPVIALITTDLGSVFRPVAALLIAASAAALAVALLMATNIFLERWSRPALSVEAEAVPQRTMTDHAPRRRIGCWTYLVIGALSLVLLFGWYRIENYHSGWVPMRFVGMCERDVGPLERSPGDDYDAWIVFEHCGSVVPGGSVASTEVRVDETDAGWWERYQWRANRGQQVFRIRDHMQRVGRRLETDIRIQWASDRELQISCDGCDSEDVSVRHPQEVTITLSE